MTGRISKLAVAILVVTALVAVAAGTASAAVIYNNIPNPFPGNVASQAFEATSTSEFGGQVTFAGTARKNPTVTVVMSSWACQSGSAPTCETNLNETFNWPVTLNVYKVGAGNSVGTKIASDTKTFVMPYRPSANKKCPGTGAEQGWGPSCFHGKAFKIVFEPQGPLPAQAIISVAYNTSDYGATPQRPKFCNSNGGCPYDSLNVGLREEGVEPGVVVGSNLSGSAYLSSTWTGAYCDGGAGGTGTFRLDAGCWAPYQPAFEVKASK